LLSADCICLKAEANTRAGLLHSRGTDWIGGRAACVMHRLAFTPVQGIGASEPADVDAWVGDRVLRQPVRVHRSSFRRRVGATAWRDARAPPPGVGREHRRRRGVWCCQASQRVDLHSGGMARTARIGEAVAFGHRAGHSTYAWR
jgi:hypothetical protein